MACSSDDGDWHYMDVDGIVHGQALYSTTATGRIVNVPEELTIGGPVFSFHHFGCEGGDPDGCVQVVDPITCLGCIAQRSLFGGRRDWLRGTKKSRQG